METARPVLETLGVDLERVPIVTRDQVRYAKPDPDLFIAAANEARRRRSRPSTVVGDSVWDMLAARRARALGIGLLSGGYATEELERAGAYRVFEDPGRHAAAHRRNRRSALTRTRPTQACPSFRTSRSIEACENASRAAR